MRQVRNTLVRVLAKMLSRVATGSVVSSYTTLRSMRALQGKSS